MQVYKLLQLVLILIIINVLVAKHVTSKVVSFGCLSSQFLEDH